MKKATLYLLLAFAPAVFAQTLENLKTQTKQLHSANFHMDFTPLAELTYPSIVVQAGGAEKFLEKVDHDYQNDTFRMRLQILNPTFNFGAITEVDGKKYCIINYRNPTRYFFEQQLGPESGPKKAAELKESARASETIFEPKRNSINVKKITYLVAVSDENTKGFWRFINLDDQVQRTAAAGILNENLKKQLGLSSNAK